MTDTEYMKAALELAKNGCGWTSPNPMVGALIVKDGEILGRGWHQRYGQPHAERNALSDCAQAPKGATLYVTLEPCCHFGQTPPCTEAILESGITRVVIGSPDPNPLVCGKGAAALRQQGIEVVEGVLREECDRLNEIFFHYILTGVPFVTMKYAMTMDGRISARSGASKWITGEASRERVQLERRRHSAIMVGVGTILADDPLLTCRMENSRNPLRIICDTHLRTPADSRVVRTAGEIPTLLATSCADVTRQEVFRRLGCQVLVLPEKNGRIDLTALMSELGGRGIDSVLLEGGGTLNWSALECGIVRRLQCYIAPKLFGGMDSKSPIEGLGVPSPDSAYRLSGVTVTPIGEDILLESEVESKCLPVS